MIIITYQREKCIGCNYCVELAYKYWRMSRKDGKSNLLGSINKKGFHTIRLEEDSLEVNEKAAEACPVKIIHIKKI